MADSTSDGMTIAPPAGKNYVLQPLPDDYFGPEKSPTGAVPAVETRINKPPPRTNDSRVPAVVQCLIMLQRDTNMKM